MIPEKNRESGSLHPPSTTTTAILIVNLGTPESPTIGGVRQYLKTFLWDKRVVEIPRVIWGFILYGFILPFRPLKLTKLYQQIWTENGSPLRTYTVSLAKRLSDHLSIKLGVTIPVLPAMTYGTPSYLKAIETIIHLQIQHLVVLPLFPQYSSTTTAAAYDALARALSKSRQIPSVYFIREYGLEAYYIQALVLHISSYWKENGRSEYLLFSFHGIPKRNEDLGDTYPEQCRKTALQVANLLKMPENNWSVSFQSRFGWNTWVQPYTDEILISLAHKGFHSVDIVSPGFAVDCLETLEELGKLNFNRFIKAGGKQFRVIPALNDTPLHVDALSNILKKYLQCSMY